MCTLACRDLIVGFWLHSMDNIREFDCILNEEDGNYEGRVRDIISVSAYRLDSLSLPTMSQLPSSV